MKSRFNSFDVLCAVKELQKCIGMRINNVYDIDSKTYLIKLQRYEEKCVILIESGSRIHSTIFEWPKNVAPSGFSMKLRKHINNKRLERLHQLGNDRMVHLQFGSGEAAYHLIVELYDKGNMILTDFEYTILNVLRPRTAAGSISEEQQVKFYVKEKYCLDKVVAECEQNNTLRIKDILKEARQGDPLKKALIANLSYGPTVIEHVLLEEGFTNATKIGINFSPTNEEDFEKLMNAISKAEKLFESYRNESHLSKGYIIQRKEECININKDGGSSKSYFLSNQEFHPMLFAQFANKNQPFKEFDTFNMAVDEYFSNLESQKLELKVVQQERDALKKLENVRKDHDQRLMALEQNQDIDKKKAELITRNLNLVENAILAIQSALANQLSWPDIEELVKNVATTTSENDDNEQVQVAKYIKKLKLETNQITLYLSGNDDNDEMESMLVDIDLGLSAYSNATKYYDMKRNAAKKQQKTIESQTKAFKSAEKKTKQTLKDVQIKANINKVRKVYWFEKFFWFISSENYLVIGGRDQKQNEVIVKRYMKNKDVYVHADVHGASSIIIKNPTGSDAIPPKTLNEAGTMAICYSVAWDAKVVTNAYWVWAEQVSKTAPTGEYLTSGSFMIRGKKNFLPLSHLILGFSFLFKVDDSCIDKHIGERKTLIPQLESNETLEEEEEEDIEVENENKNSIIETTQMKCCSPQQEADEQSINHHDYPDTHVKIQHLDGVDNHTNGTKINILTENATKFDKEEGGDDDLTLITPRMRNKEIKQNRKETVENIKQIQQANTTTTNSSDNKTQQPKRGQKSKLKKIKEKYKDQDEEERKLRMDILQSAGSGSSGKAETKKSKKKNNKLIKSNKEQRSSLSASSVVVSMPKINLDNNEKQQVFNKEAEGKDENKEEEEEPMGSSALAGGGTAVGAELDMIDSLTGIPLPDDELLFAVPIVAPYNTLSNYKFKVKLTPGTSKRGKAARTAVGIFLKDRTITSREKDLIKAVKDDQLAINIPGKVKLSAPKLQLLKK